MKLVNITDIQNDAHEHDDDHHDHKDHELVRFNLNQTDFVTSFYNNLNIISGGNKQRIYKNLSLIFVNNQKYVKYAMNSN